MTLYKGSLYGYFSPIFCYNVPKLPDTLFCPLIAINKYYVTYNNPNMSTLRNFNFLLDKTVNV